MHNIIEKNGKRYLVTNFAKFELVDTTPLGYYVWDIGPCMPNGYLPLIHLLPNSKVDVDSESLRAIRIDGAQDILAAVAMFQGELLIQDLAAKMKEDLRENEAKVTPSAYRFSSGEEMLDTLRTAELYNPLLEAYVFSYNESESIAVYEIDGQEANRLSEEIAKTGESYWGALLGPGGYIYDDPSHEGFNENVCVSNLDYCNGVFMEPGWFNTEDWTKVGWDAFRAERMRKAIPYLEKLRF